MPENSKTSIKLSITSDTKSHLVAFAPEIAEQEVEHLRDVHFGRASVEPMTKQELVRFRVHCLRDEAWEPPNNNRDVDEKLAQGDVDAAGRVVRQVGDEGHRIRPDVYSEGHRQDMIKRHCLRPEGGELVLVNHNLLSPKS